MEIDILQAVSGEKKYHALRFKDMPVRIQCVHCKQEIISYKIIMFPALKEFLWYNFWAEVECS